MLTVGKPILLSCNPFWCDRLRV